MVYTRWKCDRLFSFTPKFIAIEFPVYYALNLYFCYMVMKYTSNYCEETERRDVWWAGYPYNRDPIMHRNEERYRLTIKQNDIDLLDPKWTGVQKSYFPIALE